jgi:tRNA G18 (ribose-2'-O)-methylase SpoU
VRLECIEKLGDPRVVDYRNVRDADLRADRGLFMAEGRLGVSRLLSGSRFRARSVFVTEAALRALHDVLESLPDDTPVYLAKPRLLKQIVGYDMHRGCLAAGERGAPLDAEEVLAGCPPAAASLAVLEDVTNPDNVGGILRNALAFGAAGILLTPGCADPLYRKSVRVSMGAALRTRWARIADAPEWIGRLREAGFRALAFTGNPEATHIADFGRARERPERVALVLGTEGRGLSAAALAAADERVTIRMAPGVDSLNVATASGIALHHFAQTPKESARKTGQSPSAASPCAP